MKLSILILTLPSRRKTFLNDLLDNLEPQVAQYNDVELLVLYDNKKRSVGEKRDSIMSIARGQYTVYIDDDDIVTDDYVSSIMSCLNENPSTDCVVFDTICTIDDGIPIHCKYGIEYEYNNNASGNGFWTGKPAHTMVYSKQLVLDASFGSKNVGEDFHWVKQVHGKIKNQSRVDKVLYYYKMNNTTTETRR
jgi:hypothetical protein